MANAIVRNSLCKTFKPTIGDWKSAYRENIKPVSELEQQQCQTTTVSSKHLKVHLRMQDT